MEIKLNSNSKGKLQFVNIMQNPYYNSISLEKVIKEIENGTFVDENTIWKRSGLGFYEVVGFYVLIDLGKDVKKIIRKLGKEYQEDLPIFYDVDRYNVPLTFIVDINKNIIPNRVSYGTIIYNKIGKILNDILAYTNYDITKFSIELNNILGKNFGILKSDNIPLWKLLSPNPIADCPTLDNIINELKKQKAKKMDVKIIGL